MHGISYTNQILYLCSRYSVSVCGQQTKVFEANILGSTVEIDHARMTSGNHQGQTLSHSTQSYILCLCARVCETDAVGSRI